MMIRRGIQTVIIALVTGNVLASCLVATALASPSFVTTRPGVLRFLGVAMASCLAGFLSPFLPTRILSFFALLFCLWGARTGWEINIYGSIDYAGNPASHLTQLTIAVIGFIYWGFNAMEGRTQARK